MDRNEFDVADDKPVAPTERLDRTRGVVAKVFVIDGVELELGDQVADIWRLDDGNALRLEHLLDPADKRIGIGNVGKDVVRVHDIRKLPSCCKSSSQVLIEELNQRWNPFRRDSEFGDVGGGFDPEDRNP